MDATGADVGQGDVASTQDQGDADATADSTSQPDPHPGPCYQDVDIGNDGTPELRYISTYDNLDRLIAFEEDGGADGTVESITRWDYDSQDRVVRWERDNPPGGIVERWITYAYVADFRLSQVVRHTEGQLDQTETYEWDGNTATYVVTREGEQAPIGRGSVTHDAMGNMLTNTWDGGADDVIDQVDTYTYDDGGRLIVYETRVPEELSLRLTYEYDDAGRLTRETVDANGDGTADVTTTHTYDEAGNRLTTAEDSDSDGTTNNLVTYDYTCWP